MPTRVSYIKESVEEITRMIEDEVNDDPTVQIRTKEFAIIVRDHWRSIAAAAFDDEREHYIPSVHIERLPQRAFKRLPQYWVGTRIFYAHMIEYGTGRDRHGGVRKLTPEMRGGRGALVVGEKTPTEAFALGAKTAHFFGGTPDSESYERFRSS